LLRRRIESLTKIANQSLEIPMSEPDEKALVAQILSSYLSNNTVAAADLPAVIESVKKAFAAYSEPVSTETSVSAPKTWQPAVPVKRSVTPDAVICLCCGERFKSLRRHLQAAHQLTPAAYREAFGLKREYSLVAPNYAAQRSDLAKSLGLGRKPGMKQTAKKPGAKRAARKAAVAA
jgi:predicted transcriptional regulator